MWDGFQALVQIRLSNTEDFCLISLNLTDFIPVIFLFSNGFLLLSVKKTIKDHFDNNMI